MIVAVDGGMLDHHLQNGRHRENVGDAMRLDQAERLVDVELLGRQQDGRHAARGLHQLMHAGAMRQRRHHQRGVRFRGARHQIGEMIGHHKGHLAMGQHRRLGTPRGARGEEEPAGIVVVDRGIRDFRAGMRRDRFADGFLAESALADPPDEFERGIGDRLGMIRENRRGTKTPWRRKRWRDRRPRPASGGNWSAPRPRRAGTRRTSTRTSRRSSWNARAAGRPWRCRARPVPRPAPRRRGRSRARSRTGRPR